MIGATVLIGCKKPETKPSPTEVSQVSQPSAEVSAPEVIQPPQPEVSSVSEPPQTTEEATPLLPEVLQTTQEEPSE